MILGIDSDGDSNCDGDGDSDGITDVDDDINDIDEDRFDVNKELEYTVGIMAGSTIELIVVILEEPYVFLVINDILYTTPASKSSMIAI